MAEEAKENSDKLSSINGGELLPLWAGLLLPPAAFFLAQQINYVLVPWACQTGHLFVMHLMMLASLLLAAGGGVWSWRAWRRNGAAWPDQSGGSAARNRFATVVGMMMSAMFSLVILALWLPILFLNPCE